MSVHPNNFGIHSDCVLTSIKTLSTGLMKLNASISSKQPSIIG